MKNTKENIKENFYDFNNAEIASYDVIPQNTIARVRLKIIPGGYNDESQNRTGGYLTKSSATGAIYLNCEFTILGGEYGGRKVWSLIGLYSSGNDNHWGKMGRSFIRSILNSSSGFTEQDNSPEASQARQISSFADLDGREFVAKIDVQNDAYGESKERNVIKTAITPEHKSYNAIMQQVATGKPKELSRDVE